MGFLNGKGKDRQHSRSASSHSHASSSSAASHGTRSSTPDRYALSVNLYGRGDPGLGDKPAHWGTMLRERGEEAGELHHVREDDTFCYDRRPTQRVEASVGMSDVSYLSLSQRNRAADHLDRYGRENSNIPEVGSGNSQDWTAGAIQRLEREELAPQRSGEFWRSQVGRSSAAIGEAVRADGGRWETPSVPKRGGRPDARYLDRESRSTGRLDMSQFAGLSGSSRGAGSRKY